MPPIAGASVWLEDVGSGRLEEFKIEHDEDDKSVSCWVPCKTGKEFKVGVTVTEPTPRQEHYRFLIYTDGRLASTYEAIPNRTLKKTEVCTEATPRYFEGQREKGGLRPFQFSDVKLTDDDAHISDVSNIGEIVVKILTFKEEKTLRKAVSAASGAAATRSAPTGETVVHERSKKGLTNCVQFGALRPDTRPPVVNRTAWNRKSQAKTQLVNFPVDLKEVGRVIFKYRRLDVLIADGIAPRSVSADVHAGRQEGSSSGEAKNGVELKVKQEVAANNKENIRLHTTPTVQASQRKQENLSSSLEAGKRSCEARGTAKSAKRVKKEPKEGPFIPGEIGAQDRTGITRAVPRTESNFLRVRGSAVSNTFCVPPPRRVRTLTRSAQEVPTSTTCSWDMPQIAGATIWLEIDGQRLEEFGIERDDMTGTVTCWVPCKTGKAFRFGVSLKDSAPRKRHYRFGFNLDGKHIPSECLPKRTVRKHEACTPAKPVYFEGQEEERGLRPFQFASVRLTDDDDHISDVSSLGDLVVSVYTFEEYRVEKVRRSRRGKDKREVPLVTLGDTVVHERAKKGVASCVQFGELRPRSTGAPSKLKSKGTSSGKSIALNMKKVGKVIFKYRQMDILVADGIAPRPTAKRADTTVQGASSSSTLHAATPSLDGIGAPSRDVKEEVIDVTIDDDDEEQERLRRLKARAAALKELCEVNVSRLSFLLSPDAQSVNMQAEIEALETKKRPCNGSAPARAPKRVKREVKVESFISGEVIDLT
ncbi:hypothetical protein NMY22_g2305 [Coprinellus aureogranulatus]|nr:hypothetical protein NMY22_g2305 [Coprinellus aureogranulatus]